MMQYRAGEQPHSVFRTDRFCKIDGEWYFVTREQTQQGPYPSRQQAQLELQTYIQQLSSSSSRS